MALYLIDADILSLYFHNHETVVANVHHQLADCRLSIITMNEVIQGWQNMVRKVQKSEDLSKHYSRYCKTLSVISIFEIVCYDMNDINQFRSLISMKLNVGNSDLRLAATALSRQMTVVTRNLRDFKRVPGIQIEDWSASKG